jgi:hypothetical protein
MRRTWESIGILVVLLTAMEGCEPTLKQKLRPPQTAEAYNLPPVDDPRFQKPVEYPKNTLNKDETTLTRNAKDATAANANGGMGAGGGGSPGGSMGGMGGAGAPGMGGH